MNVLDKKYERGVFRLRCNCGKELSTLAPDIDKLIHWIYCDECGNTELFRISAETRQRLHKGTIEFYNSIILATVGYSRKRTLRNLFYQLVGDGVLPKTEKAYHKLILTTGKMRKQGLLPFDVFIDGTRWQRKPNSFKSINEAMEYYASQYKRDLWASNPEYVEIWCEKDAVADIVYEVTSEFDVPLMVARGFSSLTFLYNSAKNIIEMDKPAFIYHLGDWDASGVHAARKINETLKKFGANVNFERIAVTPEQIEQFNLPTRPPKNKGGHTKGDNSPDVEIDAMSVEQIQDIVGKVVFRHINPVEYKNLLAIEEAERQTLQNFTLGG